MKERLFLRSFLISIGITLSFQTIVSGSEELRRVWKSADGRELEATFVRRVDEAVILELTSGREAIVPFERLSTSDQDWVLNHQGGGAMYQAALLPEETQAPTEIAVSGGPDLYFTPHFSFQTDEDVSPAFISEAARIYEGSYLALSLLPHGLLFSPAEGKAHFEGSFMDDRRFDEIAREKLKTIPGQQVVGLYLGDEKRLLVPYSSLGAERLGSRLTLRKRSDTTTLVHEIVHQVMHRYLPVLPTWFSEGMAEYLSAVPYQNGRFEFRNAERGLKKRLGEAYQVERHRIVGVTRPSLFLAGAAGSGGSRSSRSNQSSTGRSITVPVVPSGAWTGAVKEYRDALLMVYYFMHLDRLEEQGRPIGEYLYLTDRAMGEADLLLETMAGYEADRIAYNGKVQQFNEALDAYQLAVQSYNERVQRYNEEVRNGVPERDRLKVGSPPVEPERPERPELPSALREWAGEGSRIDLVALVQERAGSALLQGRSLSEIDLLLKNAYESIGIEIKYAL
ncbi:MAG: hypothetical protein P1U68_16155 [Verrucomicrobiales bacterium]|nr:hypothetical protein [Verrucomicrobiales bacterium]